MKNQRATEVIFVFMPLLLLGIGLYLEGYAPPATLSTLITEAASSLRVSLREITDSITPWLLQIRGSSGTAQAILIAVIICLFTRSLSLHEYLFSERWKPTLK